MEVAGDMIKFSDINEFTGKKEKLDLVDRNIVLLFPEVITNYFIAQSEKINAKVPSKVVLSNGDALPHLTLYESRFPTKNMGEIVQRLKRLTEGQKHFEIRFVGKSVIAGTVFIDAEVSPVLLRLHERIVDGLNALREGAYHEEELELPGITDEMGDNLLRFGNLFVNRGYKPHVTVARTFDSELSQEALKVLPDEINISSPVYKIAFVESGPNGTCRQIIQEFPLT